MDRRRAYRSWKAGSRDVAALHSAIDCFARGRRAAENGIEHRLAFVAELNQLYTRGLEAAIAGLSQQENPRLIVAAVQAEANARSKTPLEDAANVAGLIIIADMATGIGLQPADVLTLSNAWSYRQACQAVFRAAPQAWPHELLRAASAPNVPFEQKARALVLGSRCLTRHDQAADQELVHAYLVHLTDCDCTLQNAIATATHQSAAHELVPGLAEQLTLLHCLFEQTFPGRRAFR